MPVEEALLSLALLAWRSVVAARPRSSFKAGTPPFPGQAAERRNTSVAIAGARVEASRPPAATQHGSSECVVLGTGTAGRSSLASGEVSLRLARPKLLARGRVLACRNMFGVRY